MLYYILLTGDIMKVLGIIAEYNPFHNGHAYHIIEARKRSNCDAIAVVMSGNFVQRGEPAIIDKWNRAAAAIHCGADIVIELPLPFACQSAELFAKAAFKVLEMIPINTLSFGCENSNMDILFDVAEIQLENSTKYNESIKKFLDQGNSYPESTKKALEKITNKDITNTISRPNNLLALEYIKNIVCSNFNIDVLPILRNGADYNSKVLTGNYSSATSIRKELLEAKINNIYNSVPKKSFEIINNFFSENSKFNTIENYINIINYSILNMSKNNLKDIFDVSEGLENKILKNLYIYNTIDDFVLSLKSKRYTYSRIRRILLNILLGINKSIIEKASTESFKYLRILSSNSYGQKIMKQLKNNGVTIITKTSDFKREGINIEEDFLFNLMNKSTNMYYLPFKNKQNFYNIEYKKSLKLRNN